MTINDLKNKQVAILGFGEKEGKATLEYLIRHQIRPTLFDKRDWSEFSESDKQYITQKNIPFIFGEGYLSELRSFEVVFRNPAFKFLDPELQKLQKKGLLITSQTKFFLENCPAFTIGVTGTKGKGTTCSLIEQILKKNNTAKVFLTGNIGKIQAFEFLDTLTKKDIVVFELSSFQLQDLEISPKIGVLLMVTPEHLDYHKDLNEYLNAKSNILKHQTPEDIAIINKDFENSLKIAEVCNSKKYFFSTNNKADCYLENEVIVFPSMGLTYPTKNLLLKGKHNIQNICAAILASFFAGASKESVVETLSNFKGLEHRLEFVAEKNGIKFYNDSFSTIPETTIAAIQSFSENKIIILGGSSKNSNFNELASIISKSNSIKALLLMGAEGQKIEECLQAYGFNAHKIYKNFSSMQEIFKHLKTLAQKEDVVLLSPACASFDMFKNYIERGEQFKELVNQW